jgi:thiol-disulfide isomerase/thioredoxin
MRSSWPARLAQVSRTVGYATALALLPWGGVSAQDARAPTASLSTAVAVAATRDPFLVPDGTPEELLAYIAGLSREHPTADSGAMLKQFFRKRARAVVTAADKVLAAKPDAKQAHAAAGFKIRSLVLLDQLGQKDAAAALAAFQRQLQAQGLQDLLPDVELARLEVRVHHADGLKREEFVQLAADIGRAAAAESPHWVRLLRTTATMAEERFEPALAANIYTAFGKILVRSREPQVASLGETMLGAGRRLQLPGKPLRFDGATLDGSRLDWSKYRGKVVLVDFWATSCEPCRAELAEIRKYYNLYHARGFEVISVSLDEDRAVLEQFLSETRYPWKVIRDQSDDPRKSLHTYYGILGIPATILVGNNGRVVAVNLHGAKLAQELQRLFSPVGSAESPCPGTENPKPEARNPKQLQSSNAK